MRDPADATEFMTVTTPEAEEMARRLAREEALFAGASSGTNVMAALRLAERLGPAGRLRAWGAIYLVWMTILPPRSAIVASAP